MGTSRPQGFEGGRAPSQAGQMISFGGACQRHPLTMSTSAPCGLFPVILRPAFLKSGRIPAKSGHNLTKNILAIRSRPIERGCLPQGGCCDGPPLNHRLALFESMIEGWCRSSSVEQCFGVHRGNRQKRCSTGFRIFHFAETSVSTAEAGETVVGSHPTHRRKQNAVFCGENG